jgi:hypothetical protein
MVFNETAKNGAEVTKLGKRYQKAFEQTMKEITP